MKQLMLGNKAFARGLYEAGCQFVSSYPGTPSTEVTEEAALYDEIYCEWAPNEKVAMEAAFGASLAGKRSFCGMKHVGLNVAADPLFTMSYTGVNAGLVICVADDAGMHSSQNEQDSRHHAIAAKLPEQMAHEAEIVHGVLRFAEILIEFGGCAHNAAVAFFDDRTGNEIPLQVVQESGTFFFLLGAQHGFQQEIQLICLQFLGSVGHQFIGHAAALGHFFQLCPEAGLLSAGQIGVGNQLLV